MLKPKVSLIRVFLVITCLFAGISVSQAAVRRVTTLADAGTGSLRQAVLSSVDGDIIMFNVRGTISLLSTITISESIEIQGAFPVHTVINGSSIGSGYAFVVDAGAAGNVKITGMKFIGMNNLEPAIHMLSGVTYIQNCLFTNNTVGLTAPSAIIIASTAIAKISQTAFFNNGMNSNLGGAIQSSGQLELSNCTFGLNTSFFGGALYVNGGNTKIIHCTFNNNTALNSSHGYAIYGQGGSISLQNSIITDASLTDLLFNNGAAWTSNGGNLYRGTIPVFMPITTNDNFSTGLNAGLAASPETDGYGHMYYRLLPASVARDIGTSPGVGISIASTDQRGAPRTMDGDATSGSVTDAGAFEHTQYTVTNNLGGSVAGSLRTQVNNVNIATGVTAPYYIDFNISGSTNIILTGATAITLNKTMIIDGYSQPGSRVAGPSNPLIAGSITTAAKPIVDIDGTNLTGSCFILGNNMQNISVIGLTIRNCDGANAPAVTSSTNNNGTKIYGNHFLNNHNGVTLTFSNNISIGDSLLYTRNVISTTVAAANTNGITLTSCSSAKVANNFIGVDTAGKTRVNGQINGIRLVGTTNSTIGGTRKYLSGNLVSGNSQVQVLIESGCNNINLHANWIGTDYTGDATVALPPVFTTGILINNSNKVYIGSADTLHRNVVGGNDLENIRIVQGDQCAIRGNYIGIGAKGVNNLTSNGKGIFIDTNCDNDTIGGANNRHGNFIGGNSVGIQIASSGTGHAIFNNVIGMNKIQTFGIGNLGPGIEIISTNNVTIGGSGKSNVITANSQDGIRLDGTNNIVVDSNFIGCSQNILPMGNGDNGIHIGSAAACTNTVIGEYNSAGHPNVICYNASLGIKCNLGTSNAWPYNTVFNNVGMGVDISSPTGPDVNDAGDVDGGTNDHLNYPKILDAHQCGSATSVSFSYDGISGAAYRVDLYSIPAGNTDPSGYGEGDTYIGNVVFFSTGVDTLYHSITGLLSAGSGISAVATKLTGANPGTSSEFSLVKIIGGPINFVPSITNASCSSIPNGSITLSISGTPSADYSWVIASNATPVGTNSSLLIALPNDYYCTITTLAGCNVATPVYTIGSTVVAEAGFILPSNPCSATPLAFTDTSNVAGGTPVYQWNVSDGQTSTLQSPSFVLNSGTYNITQTVSVGSCTDSQTQTIVVDPAPNASYSHDPGYCILLPQDTLIPVTPGGIFSGNGVNSAGVFNPFGAGPGTINYITYTITVGTCTVANTDTIPVYPYTISNISSFIGNYCVGDPVDTFFVSPAGGTISIDSIPISPIGTGTYVFDPNLITGGIDNIAYLLYDVNGCPSIDGETATILPVPLQPTANPVAYEICKLSGNQVITVTAQGSGVLNWYIDAGLTSQVHSGTSINSNVLSGHHHFWIVEYNGSCNSTPLEIDITVYDSSYINVTSPVTACQGEIVQLEATSQFTGVWNWTGDSTISNPSISNPTVQPTSNEIYIVTLTAQIGALTCTMGNFISVIIDASADCGFDIANAFSPDNDNVNDTWYIGAVATSPYNMVRVFNRWGSLLVQIKDYNNDDKAWDGTYNGKLVPQGTYYYTIELTDINRQYGGWVHITY